MIVVNEMNSENSFSIIVPSYNSEKYLQRILKILLNQNYDNYEVILIDDGSTDNTEKICKSVSDYKFKYVKKENGGVSTARNYGLDIANGEYIIFVDSDDVPIENICNFYDKILSKKKYDLIVTNVQRININGDNLNLFYNKEKYNNASIFDIIGKDFEGIYESGLLNCIYGKCYKKSIISEHFNNELFLGEDLLFNLSVLNKVNKNNTIYSNQVTYNYVIYDKNTLSTKYNPKAYENINIVYEKSLKLLNSINDNLDYSPLNKKYLLDYLTICERVARNELMDINQKIIILKNNWVNKKIFNLRKIPMKYKFYYILVSLQLYKLFIFISNKVRNIK